MKKVELTVSFEGNEMVVGFAEIKGIDTEVTLFEKGIHEEKPYLAYQLVGKFNDFGSMLAMYLVDNLKDESYTFYVLDHVKLRDKDKVELKKFDSFDEAKEAFFNAMMN